MEECRPHTADSVAISLIIEALGLPYEVRTRVTTI